MLSRLLSSFVRKSQEIKCIALSGKQSRKLHIKPRMDKSTSKPLIWLHFGPDEFGFNVKGKFGAKDFLHTNNDFRVIFDNDVAKANGDVLKEIYGLWICTRNIRFVEMLENMPNVKALTFPGKGIDGLPLNKFSKMGIKVASGGDTNAESVADFGFALILTSGRNILPGVKKAMGPDPPSFRLNDLGVEVHGKTLGIVGMGSIGLRLARRAKAFDMQVLYHNRNRREAEEKEISATYYSKLHDMLPHCDFIIIICPLTPETEKLFGEKEFCLMKDSATIINIARGPIIDQDALVTALREKQIRAAALDVTYPEPLPRDHPLLALDNVIITPHYGSATVETRRKMCQCMVDNLKAVLIDGKERMPNQVN